MLVMMVASRLWGSVGIIVLTLTGDRFGEVIRFDAAVLASFSVTLQQNDIDFTWRFRG